MLNNYFGSRWGGKTSAPVEKNKFNARKVICDGIKFASEREKERYCTLKLLEKAGEITGLRLQVPFDLYPALYFDYDTRTYTLEKRSGKHGFCVRRAGKYIADSVYYEKGMEMVVEDAKGCKTKEYLRKKRLMEKLYGIKIRET